MALERASRQSTHSVTVLCRTIISPRATILDVVSDTRNSFASTPSSSATGTVGHCRGQGRGQHRSQYIGHCRGQCCGQYKGQHSSHKRSQFSLIPLNELEQCSMNKIAQDLTEQAWDLNTGSLSRESEAHATAPLCHCANAPLCHCATAPLCS